MHFARSNAHSPYHFFMCGGGSYLTFQTKRSGRNSSEAVLDVCVVLKPTEILRIRNTGKVGGHTLHKCIHT